MSGILVLFLLPAGFLLLLDALIFGKPPGWLSAAAERVRGRLHPQPAAPVDPFDTLRVQERLGALAAEIQHLEDGDGRFYARAHRIRVAQDAYDAVLGEACRLAGVGPVEIENRDPDERARGELELASRGWFW
jgi:hypothetical protein